MSVVGECSAARCMISATFPLHYVMQIDTIGAELSPSVYRTYECGGNYLFRIIIFNFFLVSLSSFTCLRRTGMLHDASAAENCLTISTESKFVCHWIKECTHIVCVRARARALPNVVQWAAKEIHSLSHRSKTCDLRIVTNTQDAVHAISRFHCFSLRNDASHSRSRVHRKCREPKSIAQNCEIAKKKKIIFYSLPRVCVAVGYASDHLLENDDWTGCNMSLKCR